MGINNFFAGPAILDQSVLEQSKKAIENFAGMGLSILEISHRSKEFVAVMDEAEALVRKLLGVNDEYAVLFLTGGASSQFFMSAMNLLNSTDKAGYLNTGTWSTKAIKEAALFGTIEEVASSKDQNFNYIPKGYSIDPDYRYLHLTSNNTIFGTQIQRFPTTDVPFVCDMSSDIFSRELEVEQFGLIYAGAQKNLGPAGTTLVIVRKDLLGRMERDIPTMLDYRTHIAKKSSFNTPPVFPIYVSMLSLRWLDSIGGVEAIEKRNTEKSTLLYNEIDRNSLFEGTVAKEDRSHMNVCFQIKDKQLEQDFLDFAGKQGCVGLKGHRSVGGYRASIYNAMKIEGVQVLVDAMKEFESQHG